MRLISGKAGADWGIVSLPMPKDGKYDIEVPGAECQAVSIGFWPRSEQRPGGPKLPRRSLTIFENEKAGENPTVQLTPSAHTPHSALRTPEKWSVDVRIIEKHDDRGKEGGFWYYCKEDCEAVLRFGDSETAFRLGVENEFGLHWWQYVVAEKLWSGSLCEAWRIGGHIYVGQDKRMTLEEINKVGDITAYPDDTEAASVYVLLFRDGTVQVTGHWINGRIYGSYGNHKGMPVVAFKGTDGIERKWTGDDAVIRLGETVCDLSPAAHLVSEEHPGILKTKDDITIWQPFESTLLTLRYVGNQDAGQEVKATTLTHSEEGLFQGMARSVSWEVKLGGGNPSISRYVAPKEWYAANCEFTPFPVEAKEGEFTRLSKIAAEAIYRNNIHGEFSSGAIYRYLDNYGKGCYELSMDANEGRSLFRRAYWDADPRWYELAVRNAYFSADIATDHTRDLVHYHGDKYPWTTYSLIYMRFSGIPMGYLETGDPYLLETAEAIARNFNSQHTQNWPRKGIGRDADPLIGFMILWEYTGKEEYFEFARKFAGNVAAVIGEDGLYLSGSGVGPLMGCNAGAGTSWNGSHFLSGLTEYAMQDPNVPQEWLEAGGRALRYIFKKLDESKNPGFHPATTSFMGRIHWYLACRLGDEELMAQVEQYMKNLQAREHATDEVIFSGGRAHHMNNYIDNLIFFECTKDSLLELLKTGGEKAYPLVDKE